MDGMGDLLYGPQAYSVPMPHTDTISSILTGSAPPAGISTAYADSPAPGAVAASAGQAQAAATQEPGLMDRASNWIRNNPMQAQALMHGFGALSSGATHGNGFAQLGQAVGTGNAYMQEQTAANATRDNAATQLATDNALKQQEEQRKQGDSASQNAYRGVQGQELGSRMQTEAQARDISNEQRGANLDNLKARADVLRQNVASAQTEQARTRAQTALANFENAVNQQYGMDKAKAALGHTESQTSQLGAVTAQEQARTADQKLRTQVLGDMTKDEQTVALHGVQRPGSASAMNSPAGQVEGIRKLMKDHPDAYQLPNGGLNIPKAMEDFKALQGITDFQAGDTKKAFETARNAVKIGEKYTGPDGQLYVRKN